MVLLRVCGGNSTLSEAASILPKLVTPGCRRAYAGASQNLRARSSRRATTRPRRKGADFPGLAPRPIQARAGKARWPSSGCLGSVQGPPKQDRTEQMPESRRSLFEQFASPPHAEAANRPKCVAGGIPCFRDRARIEAVCQPTIASTPKPTRREPLDLLKCLSRLGIGPKIEQAHPHLIDRVGIVLVDPLRLLILFQRVGQPSRRAERVSLANERGRCGKHRSVPLKLELILAIVTVRDFLKLELFAIADADHTAQRFAATKDAD